MLNTSSYYPFLPKDSSAGSYKSVSSDSYSYLGIGDEITGSYPYSSSIFCQRYDADLEYSSERRRIYSLRNTLDYYKHYSQHYSFSSSYGNKYQQEICLISIPSIFYGSSLDKGSISLDFYVSGNLIAKLEDINKNGELIQTTGSNGLNNVAGVVLYNEGFIVLTGSWNLDASHIEYYKYNPDGSITLDTAKWIYWGAGLNRDPNVTVSSSFNLKFDGVNYIQTITMFSHAEKGDLNHSNNPTYIKYNNSAPKTNISPTSYIENSKTDIKNTVKYPYENYTGSLEKQTFISKIGIYDENKNLIGIAKLATPVKKTNNRDFTFKIKLDI